MLRLRSLCRGRMLGRGRSLRYGCILRLRRRRVRGLRVVSHMGRLVAGACYWLRRVGDVSWRIRILERAVSRCPALRPCMRIVRSWGCCVGEVVRRRRILDVVCLGVCDVRGRGRCGRGVRKRGSVGLIARPLVVREVTVVPHSDGFTRWSSRHVSVRLARCMLETSPNAKSRYTHVAYC